MASDEITLSDDALLGEYVALNDLKGFVQNRVAVPPNLMAMLIRNGEVVSVTAGGNIAVGGFWQGIKDAVVGQHSLRLLLADLKPFTLHTGINAVSRDHTPVGGEIAIEVQVNPERPSGVLGLMQEHRAVYKEELLNRLVVHLGDRALESVIGQIDAGDLRGNTMVQDKVQAEVMRIVQTVLGDMSIIIRDVSIRWALNDAEAAAIEEQDAKRGRERADRQRQQLEADLTRENDATIFKLGTEADLETAKAMTEDQLRTMVLSQELAFNEARDTGLREAELKAFQHEIEKLNLERAAKLNAELAGATGEIDKERLRGELRALQRDTEMLDTEHSLAMNRLRTLQELELDGQKKRQEIDIADDAQQRNIKNLRGLQDLENDDEDRALERDLRGKEADASNEAEKRADEIRMLELQGRMDPDVLLAIQAGQSPEVAAVLVERAKAQSSNNTDKDALLSQMMGMMKDNNVQNAEQARHALETAMTGAVGVAQGAGGGAVLPGGSGAAATKVSCPSCGRPISAEANSCKYCGWKALV